MEKNISREHQRKRRIHSIDMTRGLIVLLSVFMFSIPSGVFSFDQHAEWYGLTLVDFILPCFLTIFGTSMAIAYQKGVKRKRFLTRTIKLIIFGLIFNIIAAWSLSFSTLRFTGVLQMFAVLGIATVIITKYVKNPVQLTLIGMLILSIHGANLLYIGSACEEGLPQPDCNPSGVIDTAIFGENHIYAQGELGYDPEGIPSTFAALGNVLFGFSAGRMLLSKKGKENKLLIHGIVLIVLALIVSSILPFGKRIWTPAFALVTAGVTSVLLAIFHLLFDRNPITSRTKPIKRAILWFMEAFGKNSFFIYFGKYVLYSLLIHITIQNTEGVFSINHYIHMFTEKISSAPVLIYASIIFGIWTVLALVFHKCKWYVKI
ncbi:heparan-alpha-glucosaminide N-acetyltransferase domain-containing protein [Oceanobacillus arenosus]|nr:heparan-alpha-glucosaminide N-acetyltransferase domain-containing protein [Oceanobacillus arenosus]